MVQVVTRVILIKAPTTINDVIPFALGFLVYGIVVQVIFAIWKRFHTRSYNIFVLISILTSLPITCIFFDDYYILTLYLAFMGLIGYLTYTAFYFTSNKDAPRIIFKSFKTIFIITNHLTVFFQLILVLMFLTKKDGILFILKMVAYSLYFAVVSREVVKNLCLVMAHTTGYYSKEGIPGKGVSDCDCMICTRPFNKEGTTVTLKCGHLYHEECLKGWCLIGQNNFCYYCKEGIDKSVFPTQDYWIKSELFIKPMMNSMRSLISFSVIIFGLIKLKTSNSSSD